MERMASTTALATATGNRNDGTEPAMGATTRKWRRMNRCLPLVAVAAATRRSAASFAPPPPRRAPPRPLPLPDPASRPARIEGWSRSLEGTAARRRPPALGASPPDERGGDGDPPLGSYVRPYLKQLFLLCRPVNFPIVAAFHALGAHLTARLWASTAAEGTAAGAATGTTSPLWPLLRRPAMLSVLLSLLLVTSTSMITNDYYDARNGVDSSDSDGDGDGDDHPLARGLVPLSVAKTFVSYLYAALLLSSAFVPGVAPRLLVLGGAIATYLYTEHLKPKTWIKNLTCAFLVALSPVTSGLAAWTVLREGSTASTSTLPFRSIARSPLSFLVAALFAGIMGREILMDVTDCEGDAEAGIETIPVKYGKAAASRVALGCSFVSAMSACGASFMPWISGRESVGSLVAAPAVLLTNPEMRRVMLTVAGSGLMFLRTFAVWRTKGEDSTLAEKAIRESMLSVLLVIASFL
ncbi:hypothetical protein ACHAWF_010801 [Thalassiosira exigua]